ncbi:hypothetical protein BJ912DRAFT_1058205 [Pholiota molesta]|nr:hypothetical protein BJ912DRAFT_1058205 [Pholiota molesta]
MGNIHPHSIFIINNFDPPPPPTTNDKLIVTKLKLKMPTPPWATSQQLDFLESQLPVFHSAQRQGTTASFFCDIHREFFFQWPNHSHEIRLFTVPNKPGTVDAQSTQAAKKEARYDLSHLTLDKWTELRKYQLKSWFNNRNLNSNEAHSTPPVVDKQTPLPRALTRPQILSKVHYEDLIQPMVAEAIAREPDRSHIDIIQQCTIEAYASADEETKASIQKMYDEQHEQRLRVKLEAKNPSIQAEASPEEKARAILTVPGRLKAFFEALEKETGWYFSAICGGPDLGNGGKLRALMRHVGTDPYGQTFGDVRKNHIRNDLVTPFLNFLLSTFPESGNEPPTNDGSASNIVGPSTIPFRDSFQNTETSAPSEYDGLAPLSASKSDALGQLGAAAPTVARLGSSQHAQPSTSVDHVHPNRQPSGTAPDPLPALGPPNCVGPSAGSENLASRSSVGPSQFHTGGPMLPRTSGSAGPSIGAETPVSIDALVNQQQIIQPSHFNPTGQATHVPDTISHQNPVADYQQTHPAPSETPDPLALNWTQEEWAAFESEMNAFAAVAAADKETASDEVSVDNWMLTNGYETPSAHPTLAHPPLATTALGLNGLPAHPPLAQPPLAMTALGLNGLPVIDIFSINQRGGAGGQVGAVDALQVAASGGLSDHNLSIPSVPAAAIVHIGSPTGTISLEENPIGSATVTNPPRSALEIGDRPVRDRRPARPKEIETPKQWLETAFKYLIQDLDVVEWQACIQAWYDFEVQQEISSQRLAPATRPSPLSKWAASRNYDTLPHLGDIGQFANDWVKWWNSAQPDWRQNPDANMLPHTVETGKGKQQIQALLKAIRKSGPTAFLPVVVGLKWWAGIREQDPRWMLAVKDVSDCLAMFESSNLKRPSTSNNESGKKKKAKTKV